jgi:hypothetical protein
MAVSLQGDCREMCQRPASSLDADSAARARVVSSAVHIVACLAGDRLAAFQDVAARRGVRLTVMAPDELLAIEEPIEADLIVIDPGLFDGADAEQLPKRLPVWRRRVALHIELTPAACRVVADLIPLGVRHIVIDPYDPLPEYLDALIDLAERDRGP